MLPENGADDSEPKPSIDAKDKFGKSVDSKNNISNDKDSFDFLKDGNNNENNDSKTQIDPNMRKSTETVRSQPKIINDNVNDSA